jgi:carboxypeptidase C (cathepsin A)
MKAFILVTILLSAVMGLLPTNTEMFPSKDVNTKDFYEKLGFFAPKLADRGHAGQALIGIDVSAYWHFKPQSKSDTAPLVICLAMGPGVSSMVEMTNGLGPFKSKVDLGSLNQWWVNNPHALNMHAEVLFIDMMTKGGYSRFISTDMLPAIAQLDVYWKHIEKILTEELLMPRTALLGRDIYLHGTGYTTKFLPGLVTLFKMKNYSVKGVSASSPMLSAYHSVKGSYLWAVNNNMISEDVLASQEQMLNFLPLITKTKDEGAKGTVQRLLDILYGTKKVYKHVNYLDLMEQCTAYHKACLKAEYPRTVFHNNPRFQMVSNIMKTKFEVIDFKFSQNPYDSDLFMMDVTGDYAELLKNGIKVLFTAGDYNVFSSWYDTLEAASNLEWAHKGLFQNQTPNKLPYGAAKGAENLGFVKLDGAGFVISEMRAKELVNAIYENLLDIEPKAPAKSAKWNKIDM